MSSMIAPKSTSSGLQCKMVRLAKGRADCKCAILLCKFIVGTWAQGAEAMVMTVMLAALARCSVLGVQQLATRQ